MQKLSSPWLLVKKSFTIFFEKNNLTYFLKLYAILVPFAIFSQYQQQVMLNDDDLKNVGLGIAALVVAISYLVLSVWVYVTAVLSVRSIVAGKVPDLRETLMEGWRKLWKASLVGFVPGLIVLLGLVLLIIPGVVFAVWYYFSQFLFLDKDLGVKASLAGSKALVAGRFWAVLGRLVVVAFILGLGNVILSTIPYLGAVAVSLLGGLYIIPSFLLYRELEASKSQKELQ
jgi:hypothetical protein